MTLEILIVYYRLVYFHDTKEDNLYVCRKEINISIFSQVCWCTQVDMYVTRTKC